jgi:MinD superfamily P-loop ATPase
MKDVIHPHKVSVLSGKGGTGKTFVSVNLFAVTADALYVDTDVEEPNGFFYFDVDDIHEQNVEVFVPRLDEKKCDGTQACVKACKFNAMAYIDGKLMVFDDLCHSCGACMYACPNDALTKTYIPIGKVKESTRGPHILWGEMKPGKESGVPIVEQLNENIASAKESLAIVDSPPGVGCAVIEAVKDSDYALVVAEPSLFGLHNMKMTVRLLEHLNIPFGIVINKYTDDDNPVSAYLAKHQMSAIATIPYKRRYAEMNARGDILVERDEELHAIFSDLSKNIRKGWSR